MTNADITLNPCQSLALRRLVEAFKANDGLYSACPDVVHTAFCDFYMPPYSTAETQIKALEEHIESNLRLLEKFARQIKSLEAQLARRASTALSPPPY